MSLDISQRGASLIEVMISVSILGFGLLSLAVTQIQTTKLNDSAYYRSIASDLASDLADRIRANPRISLNALLQVALSTVMRRTLIGVQMKHWLYQK
jgi:type IV pilus assembly protein PilV